MWAVACSAWPVLSRALGRFASMRDEGARRSKKSARPGQSSGFYPKGVTEPDRDRIKALEQAGASLEAALREARSLSKHGDRLLCTGRVSRARLVLVVDDLAETRDLYCATLGFGGFRVAEGRDGFEAIERALALRPDGIVLDFAMPRMDGGEALRHLASDGRTSAIPVVMVTAHPEKVSAEIRDRCAGLLEKPCGPDDLLGAVRLALTPADTG